LQSLCRNINIGVLILTESRLNETIPSSLIKLDGYYEPIRKDRTGGGRQGGCLVYISELFTYKHREDLQSPNFEHLWADVKVGSLSFTVTTYYRPPNTDNHDTFLSTTEEILTKLNNHNTDNKIIMSDFNFGNVYCKHPILPPKPLDSHAPDTFANFGYKQLIDLPTRRTNETTALIDLAFVQNEDIVSSYGTLPKIADHDGIILFLDIKRKAKKNKSKTVYYYKEADIQGLVQYIKTFDFQQHVFTKEILQQTEAFSNVLIEAFEKFVPKRTVLIKPQDQPWCNKYTRLLLRKKNRNYSLFQTCSRKLDEAQSKPSTSQQYITKLRETKSKLSKNARIAANEAWKANRRVKNEYFRSINNIMNNYEISAKKKFSILTKLMSNQKYSTIPPLIENNNTIDNASEKSNILNNFFASKSTVNNPEDALPVLQKHPNITPLNTINTSPIEVAKIVRQLKKSQMSHCGIPGKFISFISTPLSFSLSTLFNNLFSIGHYPDLWKISHVTAIFKNKGSKTDKNNYRPISLLPTLSKVCESIIHHRLLAHCTEYNIISEKQAAYIRGDSTVNQLLYIVHKIRQAWSQNRIVHGTFLDVKAAFDRIWHKGLLHKLNSIGVEGKLLDLFVSYLADRKQVVVVDDEKSNVASINAGVPQGSKLGPLLFIIYINDIITDIESDMLIFADDCSLLATSNDSYQTTLILNRDLDKISQWAFRWKFTFNADKSKNIIFSNKHNCNLSLPLVLNDNYIEKVYNHKHLGVILTSDLDWTLQVHQVCLTANRKLAVLRKVQYLQRSTLDMLYKTTVRSVIDYGLVIYYNNLNQGQLRKFNSLQYNAGKLVSGALQYTSQSKIEAELGWESIESRSYFLGLSLFHKVHRNETRPLIKTCMQPLDIQSINRRSNGGYVPFPFKGKKFENCFFPFYTAKWNKLTKDIKLKPLEEFKISIKQMYKPCRYKFYSRGRKDKCILLTRIRVGRSYLNEHKFTIGMSDTPHCTCTGTVRESPLHFITQCTLYTEQRQILLDKISTFIPNIKNLPKKRIYQILVYGYEPDNPELNSFNSKIMIATQNFIYSTQRFL